METPMELVEPGKIGPVDNLRMSKKQQQWQLSMLEELGLADRFAPSPYLARSLALHLNMAESKLSMVESMLSVAQKTIQGFVELPWWQVLIVKVRGLF
jgi:hypothetical protein